MNRSILYRDYSIAPTDESFDELQLAYYVAALYQIARAGGLSIEEELFVEAWGKYLGIDKSLILGGFALAEHKKPTDIYAGIHHPGLEQTLIRDQLRIIFLDGKSDPDEAKVFLDYIDAMGISPKWVAGSRDLVTQDLQLLGMFREGVLLDGHGESHLGDFLTKCIRTLRLEFVAMLHHSNGITRDSVLCYLAIFERLSGFSLTCEQLTYLREVSDSFDAVHVPRHEVLELSWDMNVSSGELLRRVSTIQMRSSLLRDLEFCMGLSDENRDSKELLYGQIKDFLDLANKTSRDEVA